MADADVRPWHSRRCYEGGNHKDASYCTCGLNELEREHRLICKGLHNAGLSADYMGTIRRDAQGKAGKPFHIKEVKDTEDARDAAKRAQTHTEQWYAVRFARLKQLAAEEMDPVLEQRVYNILANGNADVKEPASYAVQLNIAVAAGDQLLKENDDLKAQLKKAIGELEKERAKVNKMARLVTEARAEAKE